jgi:DNA-binding IclR family transcriptional regulator
MDDRLEGRGAYVVRVLRVLRVLMNARCGKTLREIAKASCLNTRTIRRYVDVLQEVGFRIEVETRDRKAYYRLAKENMELAQRMTAVLASTED